MTRLRLIAVIGSIKVGRHDALKVCAILLVIEATLDGTHTLSESVAFVRRVRRPLMERTRRYRVRSLIRVDASAQDADEFLDMVRMT